MDYWLLNGFLLLGSAFSALCELIRLGRFHGLDAAIPESIRILVEENAPMLVRSDRRWIPGLNQMHEITEDAAHAKPGRPSVKSWSVATVAKTLTLTLLLPFHLVQQVLEL
jgi:hypothetical protein